MKKIFLLSPLAILAFASCTTKVDAAVKAHVADTDAGAPAVVTPATVPAVVEPVKTPVVVTPAEPVIETTVIVKP